MRINSRYRNYLRLEVLVVILVTLSFQFIADRKLAALLASCLFLFSTLGIIFWESKQAEFRKRPTFWGALVFLIFSVLPILALRLAYWDMPFELIQVAGITGSQLHKSSSYVFILLLICLFVDSYTETIKAKKEGRI